MLQFHRKSKPNFSVEYSTRELKIASVSEHYLHLVAVTYIIPNANR